MDYDILIKTFDKTSEGEYNETSEGNPFNVSFKSGIVISSISVVGPSKFYSAPYTQLQAGLINSLNKYFRIEGVDEEYELTFESEEFPGNDFPEEIPEEELPEMQLKFPLSQLPGDVEQDTLSFNKYNESSGEWEKIDTSTENGYMIADVTGFSLWGINGTQEESETSPSGGGGGGGSSIDIFEMSLPEDTDETFELRNNDRVQVELDNEVYLFNNEDNSNSESTLSFDGDDLVFDGGDERTFDLNNDGQDDLRIVLDESDIFSATFNFLAIEEDETSEEELNESTQTDSSSSSSGNELNITSNEEESNENQDDDTSSSAVDLGDQNNNNNNNEQPSEEATQAPGLGGFITANAPTVGGISLAVLIIAGIIGYFVFFRK